MNQENGLRRADQATIVCLLLVAMGALLLSDGAATIGWLPAWMGAAIGIGSLLGMLLVVRRAGALRTNLLVLFAAALAAAALYGWLSAARG